MIICGGILNLGEFKNLTHALKLDLYDKNNLQINER